MKPFELNGDLELLNSQLNTLTPERLKAYFRLKEILQFIQRKENSSTHLQLFRINRSFTILVMWISEGFEWLQSKKSLSISKVSISIIVYE